MSAASCQPRSGNCASPGSGEGTGIHRPRDSLTFPVPPQGWAAASPLGTAFSLSRMPGPPVLSATHLPFPMGSRNLKARGPMMVKPGPARQVGGRVGGTQHRRPPTRTPGAHRWVSSGLPGHCTASLARPIHLPWGCCSCPRTQAVARPCPTCIIPRARWLLDCSLRACGLTPLPSVAPTMLV